MQHIAVTGSRTWKEWAPIREFLRTLDPTVHVIVHGGARGADTMTAWLAKQQGFTVIAEPALWDLHGRAAGPIRNEKILNDYKPERLHVFRVSADQASPGTDSMVRMARERKVPITVPEAVVEDQAVVVDFTEAAPF